MKTVREVNAVREAVSAWREIGEKIAFVPTMGNLHRGHMSLVDVARQHAERVIVSIYVNPTQFGANEDYAEYPRSLDRDRRKLQRAGVDLAFAPADATIYPFGTRDMTRVTVPGLTEILCGAARPGHFDGVTSVVCRLFGITQPDFAIFGQKDYQQLLIIRRMAADLHQAVEVLCAPTQRESDGLALSSRNQYLSEAERKRAPALYRALERCAQALAAGNRDFESLQLDGLDALAMAELRPDYFNIRDADDLGAAGADTTRFAVLAAAYCGDARLIDNVIVGTG